MTLLRAVQSGSRIPSERIEEVTSAIYHDETMAMTEQKTNRIFAVVTYCGSNTEGLAVSRDRSDLTFIARVRR